MTTSPQTTASVPDRAGPAADLPLASHPQGAQALVVDDDPISSALEAHMLALLGYRATIESNPERAVALALAGGHDVMLLDLGMPRVDGFEALRRLRERELNEGRAPLPVIAVTGYASEADRLRCLMAGFNDHLSKPLQAAVLGAAIERVLAPGRATAPAELQVASDAERLRATVRRLADVKPNDHAFAPTVAESFALRSTQLIESMEGGLVRGDLGETARACRALRSSAEFLGAMGLAGLCAELTGCCERDDPLAARQTLSVILNEHQAVLTLLLVGSRGA